ncbi:hypothetical protein A2U01_0080578, partial [Trifolium medium]|nr:hypothetical protein [Trifolium medium]
IEEALATMANIMARDHNPEGRTRLDWSDL